VIGHSPGTFLGRFEAISEVDALLEILGSDRRLAENERLWA
jgi:hypothetical protein